MQLQIKQPQQQQQNSFFFLSQSLQLIFKMLFMIVIFDFKLKPEEWIISRPLKVKRAVKAFNLCIISCVKLITIIALKMTQHNFVIYSSSCSDIIRFQHTTIYYCNKSITAFV